MSGGKIVGDVPLVGKPRTYTLILENPDGSKDAYPVVMVHMLSDPCLGNLLANIKMVVSQELDTRGFRANRRKRSK